MHVCFISQEYPPDTGWGGIGTYTFEMAHGLANAGHRVTVITLAAGVEKIEKCDNLQIHRILPGLGWGRYKGMWRVNRYWPSFAWAAFQRLRLVHRVNRIEIVEAPEGRADGIFAPLVRPKSKVVVRLHTALIFIHPISDLTPNRQQRFQYCLEKNAIQRADAITSPTQAMLNLTRTWVTLRQKHVAVVPNPTDIKAFAPASPSESFEALYVGRLEHQKLSLLTRALPSILEQDKRVTVRFLGKDQVDNRGRSWQARVLGSVSAEHQSRLIFGFASRQELPHFYRHAALATLPSVWENFPYAILEAMACGTPAVCTNVGGYPELIQNGVSGVLVPPDNPAVLAEAICELIDNRARREQMGKAARERVLDCFSTERVVPRMVEFYQQVLEA